jgi:excisionase family DNA binding protein
MPRTRTEPTIPSDLEALAAREAIRILDAQADGEVLRVQMLAAGREVATLDLPPAAARLLKEMLQEMAAGRAVTVVPTETEITTQQAADLLNVSRPYVVGLVEKGMLAAAMVGNQRRLLLRDVLAYKAETRAKALEAMREIAAIDQELGLK